MALAALTAREEVRLARLARVRPLGLLAPSAATTTGRPPATPAHRGRPAAAAAAVARGTEHFPHPVARLLVTGGGRHNPVLVGMIAERAGCVVDPVEAVGLNGDMLEAQAFAYLAVRVARGLPTSCPSTTGVGAAIGGGQISQPG